MIPLNTMLYILFLLCSSAVNKCTGFIIIHYYTQCEKIVLLHNHQLLRFIYIKSFDLKKTPIKMFFFYLTPIVLYCVDCNS